MSHYDSFAEQYHAMNKNRGPKTYDYIIDQLRLERDLNGAAVCEVGCGQGELAGRLSGMGAKVTGVDASERMLMYAAQLTDRVDWILGDAMNLSAFRSEAFDIVVSNSMLMDVPDHLAVFQESCRILRPGGIMIWLVMHPCFHSPFCNLLEDGSRHVSEYAPQYWKSKGTGTLRSILGAHHRPLSQYVNDFMRAGFTLGRVLETGFERKLPDYFGAVGYKS